MLNIKKLLIGLCTFFAAGSALALPTMTITDGVSSITIADGSGMDNSPLAGQVNYVGSVGGWNFTISTGTTKPVPGSERALLLQVNVTSFAAGTLTVEFSETGFSSLPDYPYLLSTASNTDIAPGSVGFETFLDDSNVLFGTGTALGSFTSTTNGYGDQDIDTPAFSDPFSLTGRITVAHTGAGTTQADLTVEAVPEPTIIALLGLGLIGMSLTYRQRGRRVYARQA